MNASSPFRFFVLPLRNLLPAVPVFDLHLHTECLSVNAVFADLGPHLQDTTFWGGCIFFFSYDGTIKCSEQSHHKNRNARSCKESLTSAKSEDVTFCGCGATCFFWQGGGRGSVGGEGEQNIEISDWNLQATRSVLATLCPFRELSLPEENGFIDLCFGSFLLLSFSFSHGRLFFFPLFSPPHLKSKLFLAGENIRRNLLIRLHMN